MMDDKRFFFAGGGTGGHIDPALAVAERLIKISPGSRVHFFCSNRSIDERILGQTDFAYTRLEAKGFSMRPGRFISFFSSLLSSYRVAKEVIGNGKNSIVVGAGGFVSAPVCLAAHRLKRPIVLLNVDIVPGRANKLIARWADRIFLQFEDASHYFARYGAKIDVVGCPLRDEFANPQPEKVIEQLGLDREKKILLITGASSGSENINTAVRSLLGKLDAFANDWQIVHLAGQNNAARVESWYRGVKIGYIILGYFDDMASLLAAADLVVGRSGAVSVAEFAAAAVPSICMPYPYHKDRHQYLNAGKLVEAGAAIIVDDLPDEKDGAEWLWEELEGLMNDQDKRLEMKKSCLAIAKKDAALKIAEKLIEIGG
jgi:UDP-N-acetylglucosamine--N-acetylmuramyl-(pentapeptide) pyrophosphoryl-undecaprenol N-acetylglucosamine transferase